MSAIVYLQLAFTASTLDEYSEAIGVLDIDPRPQTESLRTPHGPVPAFTRIVTKWRIDWYRDLQSYIDGASAIPGPEILDLSDLDIRPADGNALTDAERASIRLSARDGAIAVLNAIKAREAYIAGTQGIPNPLENAEIIVREVPAP